MNFMFLSFLFFATVLSINCQVPPVNCFLINSINCCKFLLNKLSLKKWDETCVTGKYPPGPDVQVPTYVVNLDLPPEKRWADIAVKHKVLVNICKFSPIFT